MNTELKADVLTKAIEEATGSPITSMVAVYNTKGITEPDSKMGLVAAATQEEMLFMSAYILNTFYMEGLQAGAWQAMPFSQWVTTIYVPMVMYQAHQNQKIQKAKLANDEAPKNFS